MSRDLIGLDVIVGDDLVRPQQPRETYEGRQHMGPGGMGWSAHGKNFWNEANFWGDWWPYGREVDIEEVLGAFDIGTQQNQMDSLKVVPVGVAQVLLQRGQAAINYARVVATKLGLPDGGGKKRDEVYWKLKWHEAELNKVAPTALGVYLQYQRDSNAFKQAGVSLAAHYAHANDLKKWVMRAYVQANAVEEGSAAMTAAWSSMWVEIGAALAAFPAAALKEVAWYAKLTTWAIIGAGVIGLGLIATGVIVGAKNRISGR